MTNKSNSESGKNQNFLCIELLKKFSEKEIEGFNHFISCPYFNSDLQLISFFEVLKKKALGRKDFTHELYCRIYEQVFSEKIKNQAPNRVQKKRFNHKLNLLLRLAEHFLYIEAIEENKTYRLDLLYQKILKKEQFKLFNRHINREKKTLETQLEKDVHYHEQNHKIEKNILDYLHRSGRLFKEDNLAELNTQLDIQYLLEKLSVYLTMLSLGDAIKKDYDTSSMEAIDHLLDLPQYADHPLIKIYRTIIDLIKNQNEAAYLHLLQLLDEYVSVISHENIIGFYIAATNFCAQQIRQGNFGYDRLFELYQIMDKRNLLIEGDFIPVGKLKNAVTSGCRTGEFDWARETIEKYRDFISKPIKESVYHFNMGIIAFYQNDYKMALHHFVRVERVNLHYDSDCRVMMVKSHYETDQEYDERTLQIYRSAEKYFKTHSSLTPRNKKAYQNFIRILINLYRIQHRATKMTLSSLKEKLEQQEVNSDKQWLLKKINELK